MTTTKRTNPKVEAAKVPMVRRLLDHYGFSHTVLAKLLGVSMARLRAMSRGEDVTDEEKNAIATVQAFCALSTMPFHITPYMVEPVDLGRDPAAWFECAILPADASITPADIWAAGRRDLCTELCAVDTPEEKEKVLDTFEPGWREHYASEWEVVDEDGVRYIRRKDNPNIRLVEPGLSLEAG